MLSWPDFNLDPMNLYNAPAVSTKSPEKSFKCVFSNGEWKCIASVPGLGKLTGSGRSPREAYESICRYV